MGSGFSSPHYSAYNNLAFIGQVLDEYECQNIINAAGELGKDPSSKDYTKRNKNIGYMISVGERWYMLEINYFYQNDTYNETSSGGIWNWYN